MDEPKEKKILITGSEGFIGKSLVKKLESTNNQIIKADKKNGIDLCEVDQVNVLPDVDIIYHLAAFNGTKWFYDKPYDVVLDNTLPTINLLNRYAKSIELFIFAGTCESYAGVNQIRDDFIPTDENVPLVIDDVTNPRWSYGGSKIGNEVSVIAAHKQFGMNYQILRFHNIYGPDQVDHFFPEFIHRARKGNLVLKGYSNTRSFLHIDDSIDYVYELLLNKKSYNQIIHIGSDNEVRIEDVAKVILKILGIEGEIIKEEAPHGSVLRRVPNINKLLTYTKKRKLISLEEGIRKMLEVI